METIRCNKCNKKVLDGVRFCPFCGSEQKVTRKSTTYDKNPFDILQVTAIAEDEVIKAAYQSLAKKYHPDTLTNGSSEDRMKELNWAFNELSDPKKRNNWKEDMISNSHTSNLSDTPKYNRTEQKQPARQDKPKNQNDEPKVDSQVYTKPSSPSPTVEQTNKHSKSTNRGAFLYLVIPLAIISVLIAISSNFSYQTQSNSYSKSSPTSRVPTSTPKPTAIPFSDYDVVTHDRFISNSNEWDITEIFHDYGIDQSSIINDQFVWTGNVDNKSQGFHSYRWFSNNVYDDFIVSIYIPNIDCDYEQCSAGITFRSGSTGKYTFIIRDQHYAIYADYIDRERVVLVDWTFSSEINHGSNKLLVIAEDRVIEFHINDKFIKRINDYRFAAGRIGLLLGVYGSNSKATVVFDNFRLWIPKGSESDNSVSNVPKVTVRVNTNSLRIRSGPGTEYSVVGRVYFGEDVQAIGRDQSLDWVKVDRGGWVSTDFLLLVYGQPKNLPVLQK